MNKFMRLLITGAAASAVMIPVAVSADTNIDETTFPDETFRQYVTETFDKDSNSVLSDAEINDAKEIVMISSSNSTVLSLAKSMGAKINVKEAQLHQMSPFFWKVKKIVNILVQILINIIMMILTMNVLIRA